MTAVNDVFKKTLGGLSPQYYFRQLFFALVLAAGYFYIQSSGDKPIALPILTLLIINTALYPYSRFVYERVVGFVMGENIFIVNALFMMMAKLCTMLACWAGAILIAPVGLIYLYFHHSRPQA